MLKKWNHLFIMVTAGIILSLPSTVLAASAWKWTRGQGWSEGGGAAKSTAREQLKHAYELERKGEFYDSAKQYFLLLRVYPASKEAGVSSIHHPKPAWALPSGNRTMGQLKRVSSASPGTWPGTWADME